MGTGLGSEVWGGEVRGAVVTVGRPCRPEDILDEISRCLIAHTQHELVTRVEQVHAARRDIARLRHQDFARARCVGWRWSGRLRRLGGLRWLGRLGWLRRVLGRIWRRGVGSCLRLRPPSTLPRVTNDAVVVVACAELCIT